MGLEMTMLVISDLHIVVGTQEILASTQVRGMRQWLEERNLNEKKAWRLGVFDRLERSEGIESGAEIENCS